MFQIKTENSEVLMRFKGKIVSFQKNWLKYQIYYFMQSSKMSLFVRNINFNI